MFKTNQKTDAAQSPVMQALRSTRGAWFHVGLFSSIVNMLMLTGSFYMLQVYDRVLSSRSVPTLVALSLIALLAYALQGILDSIRHRLLGRIGASVDEQLSPLTARAAFILPLKGVKPQEALQPVRDLDAIRTFLSGMGPTALLDMPYMPVFLGACFLLHPWLGWLAVAGAIIIVILTFFTEKISRAPTQALMRSSASRNMLAESGRRNAVAIAGLGMGHAFQRQYRDAHDRHVNDGLSLSESAARISTLAKVIRYVLQSAVLGLGAYVVIRGEATGGVIIAASILTSRALAPIEVAVAHWKSFVAARQGLQRLKSILPLIQEPTLSVTLPPPRMSLKVEDLAIVAPGTQKPIVQGVNFSLQAGQGLGLIGPSGSGKSTLARAIVGAWPPARGTVRLDGALLTQWTPDQLGAYLGYLPQDVELFDGTIGENIARFDPNATDEAILKAAQTAGAHELIVSFPEGYNTRVGEAGAVLSGGQRQRVALARALYGDPFMVVLDEPNASLDAEGDEALSRAIQSVRSRGGIVIVITHRASGLAAVDLVGAMAEGKLGALGPRDQVLQQMMKQSAPHAAQPAQRPAYPNLTMPHQIRAKPTRVAE